MESLVEFELLSKAWVPKRALQLQCYFQRQQWKCQFGPSQPAAVTTSTPGRDTVVLAPFCCFWKQCCIGCSEVLRWFLSFAAISKIKERNEWWTLFSTRHLSCSIRVIASVLHMIIMWLTSTLSVSYILKALCCIGILVHFKLTGNFGLTSWMHWAFCSMPKFCSLLPFDRLISCDYLPCSPIAIGNIGGEIWGVHFGFVCRYGSWGS